jgi:alpha-L-fucosidase
MSNVDWFKEARFGVFIHYGVYSELGRAEWVMNREDIKPAQYREHAKAFNPDKFDADAICALALKAGAKYVVFTTMHHDGFRLYDSKLSDYNSVNFCGRDLTAEMVAAAKKHGLKIGLYHSLNNWYDQPDAVDAWDDTAKYEVFIENTHARIKELITTYPDVDIMWYDGWWPFDATGWQGEKMNKMVSEIQPKIIFNGRNGLDGDFSTPEGHISAPTPWRPWEACMTLNDHWGFHAGDENWKSADEVINMLTRVANGQGNLLLNIGPRGDGSIPEATVDIFEKVGAWMDKNSEAIFGTDIFGFDLMEKGDHRGDWLPHGEMTAKGSVLYLQLQYPVKKGNIIICGIEQNIQNISLLSEDIEIEYTQEGRKLEIVNIPDDIAARRPVFKIECDDTASIYQTGGMRIPKGRHPHYDPLPSDIQL